MEFPRWLYSADGNDRYFATEGEYQEAQKHGAWFASRLEAKQYADGKLGPKSAFTPPTTPKEEPKRPQLTTAKRK